MTNQIGADDSNLPDWFRAKSAAWKIYTEYGKLMGSPFTFIPNSLRFYSNFKRVWWVEN